MLKSQGIPPSEESVEICQFRPIKGNQPPCELESSTPYGFCKKHSRTVQAKRAKHAWDESHSKENQELRTAEPVSTPVSTPVPVPVHNPFVKEKPSIDKLAEQLVNMEKRILNRTPPTEKNPDTKYNKVSSNSMTQPPQRSAPAKKMSKSGKAKLRAPPVKEKRKPEPPRTKKIKPNIWGRYEDLDTHILFDPKTKQAFGVQNRNGTISALGKKHINICKRHGWHYKVPRGYNYSESDNEKESEDSDDESETDNDDTDPSVTDGDLSETYLDSESEEERK